MSFENFLTRKAANDHSIKNHGILRVLVELFANEEKLKKHFDDENQATLAFRNKIKAELSDDPARQKANAERWTQYLKPRISVLKFWSVLFAAFITIYGLGSAMFSLIGKQLNVGDTFYILYAFIAVSLVLLVVKYVVDKRIFWYEYMLANLEAIIKL